MRIKNVDETQKIERVSKEYEVNGETYKVTTYGNLLKFVKSENYNTAFDKRTGMFLRWGKTKEEDPEMSKFGPEILDLEISQGKCMGQCPECYKCNGAVENVHNMTLEEFKTIFHKVSASGLLEQIAFGICDIGTNPDFFNMMRYAKENGVIPNYTCHGLDMNEEYAKLTAEICGAVAVSVYNKEKSYNAVKMLTDAGMKQVNFHCIAHDKSFNKIKSIIDDIKSDERLKGLNALVLLRYKPKGNGVGKFNQLTIEQYKEILKYAEEKGVNLGFDSCSAPLYLEAIKEDKDFKQKSMYAEPCESALFSSYINCKGQFYACSFCEGEGMWKDGIDVLNCVDFIQDVWYNERTVKFRNALLGKCRNCPMFNLCGGKHEN